MKQVCGRKAKMRGSGKKGETVEKVEKMRGRSEVGGQYEQENLASTKVPPM